MNLGTIEMQIHNYRTFVSHVYGTFSSSEILLETYKEYIKQEDLYTPIYILSLPITTGQTFIYIFLKYFDRAVTCHPQCGQSQSIY